MYLLPLATSISHFLLMLLLLYHFLLVLFLPLGEALRPWPRYFNFGTPFSLRWGGLVHFHVNYPERGRCDFHFPPWLSLKFSLVQPLFLKFFL